MIGFQELLLILIIVLIVFGAGRFPKIMQNFAEGINVFKKTIKEEKAKPTKKPFSKKTPSKKKSNAKTKK